MGSTDAWATITTTIVIPLVETMRLSLVPDSFVDTLLWLPSKTSQSKMITYGEIGPLHYIKGSDIAITDLAFEAVEKQ
jgi:hypothetical protein